MDQEYSSTFIETVLDEADGAPTQSESLNSSPYKRKVDAHDRRQVAELAAVLSNTEIIVLKIYQSSGLSQRGVKLS